MDPRLQTWMALELVAIVMGFLVLGGFLLFVPPMSHLFGGELLAEEVLDGLVQVILLKWPMVVVAFAVLFAFGLLLSHRLVGPLYALKKVIAAWQSGDRTARVYFRKYDYLLSAKEPLNTFFDTQEKISKEALALADKLETEAADPAMKQQARQLKALVTQK